MSMNKPFLKLAKLATENIDLKKEAENLREKVAKFEKRAEAEQVLIDLIHSNDAPIALRPSSVEDFLNKRAQIEEKDLETVKLAAKMASAQDFGIGDPENESSLFNSSGSKADDMFTEWLLDSEG